MEAADTTPAPPRSTCCSTPSADWPTPKSPTTAALVDYNVAILQVHFRKNSLLEYNGVYLAEGPWPAKAYFDARKRARERDAALFINYGFTQPKVFSRGAMPQHDEPAGRGIRKQRIALRRDAARRPAGGAERLRGQWRRANEWRPGAE